MIVPTMAEMMAQGKQPEVLFWVGSAGSFDDRAKKITRAFVKVLHAAKVDNKFADDPEFAITAYLTLSFLANASSNLRVSAFIVIYPDLKILHPTSKSFFEKPFSNSRYL